MKRTVDGRSCPEDISFIGCPDITFARIIASLNNYKYQRCMRVNKKYELDKMIN